MPGAKFGLPWLVNPILLGIAAIALYWFARHAFGETLGRTVAALFSLTPMALFMAGTWMNHVAVLCLTTLVLAALVEWERAPSRRHAFAGATGIGLALGLMATVRPLDAIIVAVPIGLLIAVCGLVALRRTTRWDALLIGLFVAQVAAYASYSLVGEFLGARFLYTALPTLVVLLARAPFTIGDRLGDTWRRITLALVLSCIAISWTAFRAQYTVWGLANQARHTRQTFKVDIAGAVRAANIHNAIVFFHEPLGGRLLRRMWGMGVSRSEAARLLDASDACSLLAAIDTVEADRTIPDGKRRDAILNLTTPFVAGEQSIEGGDPPIHLSSRESVTPPCRAEFEADARVPSTPFGPALPLEPIGADGRLAGDIIYAADLGGHNEVLRARFGNRTWYRLTTQQSNGDLRATIVPY